MRFTRTLRMVGSATVVGAFLFGSVPTATADQIRDGQWALGTFDSSQVWKESTGKGITVAVIDNGVKGDHPDLQGNILAGKNFSTGAPADQENTNEHGTAMASIIAAHGHGSGNMEGVKGLAPDAKILPVKYWDSDDSTIDETFAEPLRYAVDQGADIVNMSFGSSRLEPDEKQAIAYAAQKDVLLIASSGNDGTGESLFPATAPGVLSVGAIGKDMKIWEGSNYGSQLKLVAPGEKIYVAGIGKSYFMNTGTSGATAYVSAQAALLRDKFPDLTAGQIANRMTSTATEPEDSNFNKAPDPYYGYGIIDPLQSLTADIPAGPENGPLEVVDPTDGEATAPAPGFDVQAERDADDKKAMLGIIGFALIILVVIGIIVTIIIVVKRKNRRNPPPGGFGGSGGGYETPGGYPYQQQPPAQAPGQWPNR